MDLQFLPLLEVRFRLFSEKECFRCFALFVINPSGAWGPRVYFRRSGEVCLCTIIFNHCLYLQPQVWTISAYSEKRRVSTCICSGSNLNKHCLQHPSSHTWVSIIRRSQLNRREGHPQV